MCVGVQLSMHVLKPKHYVFVVSDFLKVQEVKYLFMLNTWWIFRSPRAIFM
jgi:hypothetical protein